MAIRVERFLPGALKESIGNIRSRRGYSETARRDSLLNFANSLHKAAWQKLEDEGSDQLSVANIMEFLRIERDATKVEVQAHAPNKAARFVYENLERKLELSQRLHTPDGQQAATAYFEELRSDFENTPGLQLEDAKERQAKIDLCQTSIDLIGEIAPDPTETPIKI